MVFRLFFYCLLFNGAFSQNTSVATYDGSTEYLRANSTITTTTTTTTENPDDNKNIERIGHESTLETKCPYGSTLLQLLNILLEFLNYSSELEKVYKVLKFMQANLESLPASPERDALFIKIKLIENRLAQKELPQNVNTPDTLPNLQSRTTIVFKNNIPSINQPNCKDEFARLLQTAYNAYTEIAKFPNCQSNVYPYNDGILLQNVYSIDPKKPYQFDINFHNTPSPITNDRPGNSDGLYPKYPYEIIPLPPQQTLPPYEGIYTYLPKQSGDSSKYPYLQETNKNPFNPYNSQQINNNNFDVWPKQPGDSSEYPYLPETNKNPFNPYNSPQINNNNLDVWTMLPNKPLQPDGSTNLIDMPLNPNLKFPYDSSPSFQGNPYFPITPGGTINTPKEEEFMPNGIGNFIIPKEPEDELNLPGQHGVGIENPPTLSVEALLKLLSSSPDNPNPNVGKLPKNNEIDYTVLLNQLGIPVPSTKNNIHVHPNVIESGPKQSPHTGQPESNVLPGSESIDYPTLIQPEDNSGLYGSNGLPKGNDLSNMYNNKPTIIDKFRIPFQYDKVTVNHDTIPYILEYIASQQKQPYQNSYINDYLKGNQFGNYKTLVENNPYQKPITSDLPWYMTNGMTNQAKLPNKAGIIELTYVLKRPKPLVYHPVYYVKYRLPYSTFVQNYENLLAQKPVLRNRPDQFYQELLNLSNVTEVSPDLQGYGKEDILKLVFNNGALVKAKLVNGNDNSLKEQLEIIKGLNSNSTPEDISRLTNATLGDIDSDIGRVYSRQIQLVSRPTVSSVAGVNTEDKSWPFLNIGNIPPKSLYNSGNAQYTVRVNKPLSSTILNNPYRQPVYLNNNAFTKTSSFNYNPFVNVPHEKVNNIGFPTKAFVLPTNSKNNVFVPPINYNNIAFIPPIHSNNNAFVPSIRSSNNEFIPPIRPNKNELLPTPNTVANKPVLPTKPNNNVAPPVNSIINTLPIKENNH